MQNHAKKNYRCSFCLGDFGTDKLLLLLLREIAFKMKKIKNKTLENFFL